MRIHSSNNVIKWLLSQENNFKTVTILGIIKDICFYNRNDKQDLKLQCNNNIITAGGRR
jgi:hypothetical protein